MKYWETIADKLSAAGAPFALLVFLVASGALLRISRTKIILRSANSRTSVNVGAQHASAE